LPLPAFRSIQGSGGLEGGTEPGRARSSHSSAWRGARDDDREILFAARRGMTLVQLRYLLALADNQLNITAAAARLNATQPGISKQLSLLADELGFQLFVRRGNSLERVTPAGADVIERARTILMEAENIRSYAADFHQQGQGELRIIAT